MSNNTMPQWAKITLVGLGIAIVAFLVWFFAFERKKNTDYDDTTLPNSTGSTNNSTGGTNSTSNLGSKDNQQIGATCFTNSGDSGTIKMIGTNYVCQSLRPANPCLLSHSNAGAGVSGVLHKKPNGTFVCVSPGTRCTTAQVKPGMYNANGYCVSTIAGQIVQQK